MKQAMVVAATLALCVLAAAQCQPGVKAEMNAGAAQYRAARYEDAITHFRAAVTQDPSCTVAHLYLGTALAQLYIPGADTPDNIANAEAAIREFQQVLAAEPNNKDGLSGIAALNFQMKRFQQARRDYQRVADADANDAEAYYAIGIIDWTESYKARMEARAGLKMKPDQPMDDLSVCYGLRDRFAATVDEGMKMLTRALEIRPDYDDAMAYMNLLYREKADYECGDMAARDKDLQQANKWVDLTMATKKRKQESPSVH